MAHYDNYGLSFEELNLEIAQPAIFARIRYAASWWRDSNGGLHIWSIDLLAASVYHLKVIVSAVSETLVQKWLLMPVLKSPLSLRRVRKVCSKISQAQLKRNIASVGVRRACIASASLHKPPQASTQWGQCGPWEPVPASVNLVWNVLVHCIFHIAHFITSWKHGRFQTLRPTKALYVSKCQNSF